MQRFIGGNTDIILFLLCRTVIVTLILLKFCILAKLEIYLIYGMYDGVKVISNIISRVDNILLVTFISK